MFGLFTPAPDNGRPSNQDIRKAGGCVPAFWQFMDGLLTPRPPAPPDTAATFVLGPPIGVTEFALDRQPDKRSARQRAAEWLGEHLGAGSLAVTELQRRAHRDGVSWRTIRRAQKKLGIRPRNSASGWSWSLPASKAPAVAPLPLAPPGAGAVDAVVA
jgi:hypothetical protein